MTKVVAATTAAVSLESKNKTSRDDRRTRRRIRPSNERVKRAIRRVSRVPCWRRDGLVCESSRLVINGARLLCVVSRVCARPTRRVHWRWPSAAASMAAAQGERGDDAVGFSINLSFYEIQIATTIVVANMLLSRTNRLIYLLYPTVGAFPKIVIKKFMGRGIYRRWGVYCMCLMNGFMCEHERAKRRQIPESVVMRKINFVLFRSSPSLKVWT